jgi:hypothetical protein
MTVSTTVNSMLLTFGPILATYHGFSLKTKNSYHACFLGAVAFLLTQVAKFILLALLFPIFFPGDEFDESAQNASSPEQEVLKCLVNVVDVVGLYFVLNAKRMTNVMGDIENKILSIGLGWAAAELATTHFIDIIFQAWSNEAKIEYLLAAISANFDLVEILSLTTLAYLLTKKEVQGNKKTLIYILVLLRELFPVISKAVATVDGHTCTYCQVSMKAVFAFVFYLFAQKIKSNS